MEKKKKEEDINAVLSSFTHATLLHKLQPGNLFSIVPKTIPSFTVL